jgi:hypothetical protein
LDLDLTARLPALGPTLLFDSLLLLYCYGINLPSDPLK